MPTASHKISHLTQREDCNPVNCCQQYKHTRNVSAGGLRSPSGYPSSGASSSAHMPASNQGTREHVWAPRSGCLPWSYPTSRPKGSDQPPPRCLSQNRVTELEVGCPTRQPSGPRWPHLGGDATVTAVLMVPPPVLPKRAYSLMREGSQCGHQRYFLVVLLCFSACSAKHGSKRSNKSLGHRIDP